MVRVVVVSGSMSLSPLLAAPAVVQIHAMCALAAFVLGAVQFAAPKGTVPHRVFGWVWVGLMVVVGVTSFFISGRPWIGPFGPIHVLSLLTLAVLPSAVLAARRGDVTRHRRSMVWLFVGALLVAGAFTLLPQRIMGQVVFG